MRTIRRKKSVNFFLVGLFVLPLVAVGAYFWATGMISALENYRSPLQSNPPLPGGEIGEPLTSRVVLVVIDALRYDTSLDATVMPALESLRQIGASAAMKSRPPSFSAPGWTTILTGAWPDINDSQPMNPPNEFSVRSFTQDAIFAAADRAGFRTAVSGYSWFEGMLAQSSVDVGFYTMGEDHSADRQVVDAALPWLDQEFQLVLIHLDQVDFAGHHEGGPRDPRWAQAAARADSLLAEIVSATDLSLETLIVVSDHGQIDKGGHGGSEPVTLMEPFVAAGSGILPGRYNEISMVDVAPTLAALLGTSIPASSQGRPLLEMLAVGSEQATGVMELVKDQQRTLLTAYSEAIGESIEPADGGAIVSSTQLAIERARMGRLGRERIWRNMIALFLVMVPGYTLFLRREKRIGIFLIAVTLYLMVFLFRYLVLDGNTFGLSWITGITEFIIYIAVTSLISLVLAWLFSMSSLHAFRQSPSMAARTALGSVWFVLYFLAIPILLNFAVNGIFPTWTLPEFTIQFVGFLALVQSLFVAAIGLFLVGLSALLARFIKVGASPATSVSNGNKRRK